MMQETGWECQKQLFSLKSQGQSWSPRSLSRQLRPQTGIDILELYLSCVMYHDGYNDKQRSRNVNSFGKSVLGKGSWGQVKETYGLILNVLSKLTQLFYEYFLFFCCCWLLLNYINRVVWNGPKLDQIIWLTCKHNPLRQYSGLLDPVESPKPLKDRKCAPSHYLDLFNTLYQLIKWHKVC